MLKHDFLNNEQKTEVRKITVQLQSKAYLNKKSY